MSSLTQTSTYFKDAKEITFSGKQSKNYILPQLLTNSITHGTTVVFTFTSYYVCIFSPFFIFSIARLVCVLLCLLCSP